MVTYVTFFRLLRKHVLIFCSKLISWEEIILNWYFFGEHWYRYFYIFFIIRGMTGFYCFALYFFHSYEKHNCFFLDFGDFLLYPNGIWSTIGMVTYITRATFVNQVCFARFVVKQHAVGAWCWRAMLKYAIWGRWVDPFRIFFLSWDTT